MPNYRRAYVQGGTFFFTVVTFRRRHLFHLEVNRSILGSVIRQCQRDWPFEINAMVLLPDHLHAILTLPPGDDNYSGRWSVIKKDFTTAYLASGGTDWIVSDGKLKENRRGVWQPRFWEHTIEDVDDYETHFDYIHFNPVKHKLAQCPRGWEASSFHRWAKHGVYPENWACGKYPPPQFPVTKENYGEPS